MKVLMKPIEMIAWFTEQGVPNPVKYRTTLDDETKVSIKVDRIITRDEEKLAGNRMLIYRCQSMICGIERLYELKYEINSCKWFLYKM